MKFILFFLCLSLPLSVWGSDDHGHHDEPHHEDATGPHGGKLLVDEHIQAEFAIVHQHGQAVFRLWLTENGQPINGGNITLTYERLQAEPVTVNFHQQGAYWQSDSAIAEPHSFDLTLSVQIKGQQHRWQWGSYEGRVTIRDDMASKNGLTWAYAEPGDIAKKLKVFGRLKASPENMANVGARFPGIVQNVFVNIGDEVKKGQKLVTIESNESLQSYTVTSPIDGIVQHRMVNVGEVTSDKPLMKLLNINALWGELKVFHNQRKHIKQGQQVQLIEEDRIIVSNIHHIIPGPDDAPYLLARIWFDNSDKQHTPGDLISANIIFEKQQVAVRVQNRAIHELDGQTVVFIKEGESYEPRAVELGQQDASYTQIISGIKAGTPYALDNSYLIKADIEKSGAGHVH